MCTYMLKINTKKFEYLKKYEHLLTIPRLFVSVAPSYYKRPELGFAWHISSIS